MPHRKTIRQILAANLTHLKETHETLRSQAAIAAKSGLGQRTVGRALDPEDDVAPTVETVAALAKAFGVTASNLVDPYFATMGATSPAAPTDPIEQRLLNAFRALADQPEAREYVASMAEREAKRLNASHPAEPIKELDGGQKNTKPAGMDAKPRKTVSK